MNYDSRSEFITGAKLICPKHGEVSTFDLYEKGKIAGVGCVDCYLKYPYAKQKSKTKK